jgi:hypothetical protein
MGTLRIGLLLGALTIGGCGDDAGTGGNGGAGEGASGGGTSATGGAGGQSDGGAGGEGASTSAGGSGTGGSGGAPSDIGQPCESDEDCQADCLLQFPGGYCTIRNCDQNDPKADPQCPDGSICRGGGGIGSTACFDECATVEDCRDGYVCCSADGLGGQLVCAPPNFLCG